MSSKNPFAFLEMFVVDVDNDIAYKLGSRKCKIAEFIVFDQYFPVAPFPATAGSIEQTPPATSGGIVPVAGAPLHYSLRGYLCSGAGAG